MFMKKTAIGMALSLMIFSTGTAMAEEVNEGNSLSVVSGDNGQEENVKVDTSTAMMDKNYIELLHQYVDAGTCSPEALYSVEAMGECLEKNGESEAAVLSWGSTNSNILELMKQYPYLVGSDMTDEQAAQLLNAVEKGQVLAGTVAASALSAEEFDALAQTFWQKSEYWGNISRMAGEGSPGILQNGKELIRGAMDSVTDNIVERIRFGQRVSGGRAREFGDTIKMGSDYLAKEYPSNWNGVKEMSNAVRDMAGEAEGACQELATRFNALSRSAATRGMTQAGESLVMEAEYLGESVAPTVASAESTFSTVGNTARAGVAENKEEIGMLATAEAFFDSVIAAATTSVGATLIVGGGCAAAAGMRAYDTLTEYADDRKKFMSNRMEEIDLNDGID